MSAIKPPRWQEMPLWGLVGVCFTMALLAHIRIPETSIDDAFITYRYSANLATGHGLVYNPGEHVLGTTTPGYAILLGAIASVAGPATIPIVSRVINFFALVIAATCAGLAGKQVTGSLMTGGALFAIVLTARTILLSSVSGMESATFLALIGLAMLALINHKWHSFAVLSGLLPVVRPEGVFFVGLSGIGFLAAWVTRREPSLSFRTLAEVIGLMILPSLIWGTIAWIYYGSPIPLSIVAKRHGLYPLPVEDSIGKVVDGLARNTPFRNDTTSGSTVLAIGFVVMLMYLWGSLQIARRFPLLLLLCLFGLILIVFYATSATLIFPHYLAHFDATVKLCLLASLYAILSWPIMRWTKNETRRRLLTLTGAISTLIVLAPAFLSYPWNSVWYSKIDTSELDEGVRRQGMYRRLAKELNPQIPPNTVVLMPEIGELGFYLGNARVLDACGLVSPEAHPYLPVLLDEQFETLGVIPSELVREYRPDLIITLETFGRPSLWTDPLFWEDYVPVVVWRGDWLPWGSKGLYVFSRNDFEPGLNLYTTFQP